MIEKTCAACDYKLEGETIKVRIVEVCCTECAQKLSEAQASVTAAKGA